MKTIEQKAKAYDNAIERAKDFMNGEANYELKIGENIMCWVFPELRESEDERIRQKLLFLCYSWRNNEQVNIPDKKEVEKTIAWLKKQGEQKSVDKAEHKHTCELNNSYTYVKFPFKAKVKSSGKIVTIHGGQLGFGGEEWIKYQSNAEDRYKVYKPNDLELVCEIKQNPSWSDEDEINYNYALAACKYYGESTGYADTKTHQKANNWLKSLKDKMHWKPSDKQMERLKGIINSLPHQEVLYSLYQDLKKLKE